jgi:nitrate/nitrite transporter NarK
MKIFDFENLATFTLHMTWLAFFLSFLAWFSFAPFATTIQTDLALTIEQLKVLSVCNLALTVPARIITGIILDRFGVRVTFSGVLLFTITAIAISAYFVQAAAGATFSIVPLIKKEVTGQIAGTVGAYGNVGGIVFLTVNNYTNWQTLFNFMGVAALVCASCCVFFLHVPVQHSEKSNYIYVSRI